MGSSLSLFWVNTVSQEPIAKVKLIEIASSLHSNDCKDALCHCERSEAIPLLNAFAITSQINFC